MGGGVSGELIQDRLTRGWANPRQITSDEIIERGGFLLPLSTLLSGPKLSRDEKRPFFVSEKLHDEISAKARIQVSNRLHSNRFIYVPNGNLDLEHGNWLARRITPDSFVSEAGFEKFVLSRFSQPQISELLLRRDISSDTREKLALKIVLDANEEGNMISPRSDAYGVGLYLEPSGFLADVIKRAKNPSSVIPLVNAMLAHPLSNSKISLGVDKYLNSFGNRLKLDDLINAIGRVRLVAPENTLTDVHISKRLLKWVKELSHSFDGTGQSNIVKFDEEVKKLSKPYRRELREELRVIAEQALADGSIREFSDTQDFAILYTLHRDKNLALFNAHKEKLLEKIWAPRLAFSIGVDGESSVEVLSDILRQKYQNTFEKNEQIYGASKDSQRDSELRHANEKLVSEYHFLFSDYDWSHGKLSKNQRQQIANEFVKDYIEFHDAKFDGDHFDKRGVERFIEEYGKSCGYNPKFNKDVIRTLLVEGTSYDVIELAKRGILPERVAKQAIGNIAITAFGNRAAKAIFAAGDVIANDQTGLASDVASIYRSLSS
ncbi:MAG: hypothetical protein U0R17_01625 [Acidimicrobiia bacterium]